LTFTRRDGGLRCVLNAGRLPLRLPGGDLLLASAALVDGALPPNAAAWLI
jgi:alpha-glucosidase